MKNEQNHELSYKSVLFLSSLASLLIFLALPTWTRQREEERVVNARRNAEVVGYQIFEIYRQAARNTYNSPSSSSGSRVPASTAPDIDALKVQEIGSIGNDPWGQPYRYKILSAVGDELKVQIWSAGPNKNFETKEDPNSPAEIYTGDDVGVVLSLNQRPHE